MRAQRLLGFWLRLKQITARILRLSLAGLDWVVGAIGSWSVFAFPISALILIGVTAMAGSWTSEMCSGERGCSGWDQSLVAVMAIVVLAVLEATLLFLGAGLAYLARHFRRKRLDLIYAPRRESVRDWLARGDITPKEYEAIVPQLELMAKARFNGERIWAAADLSLILGFMSLVLVPPVYAVGTSGLDDSSMTLIRSLMFWLVIVGLAMVVVALIASPIARAETRKIRAATDSALEQLALQANTRRLAATGRPEKTRKGGTSSSRGES